MQCIGSSYVLQGIVCTNFTNKHYFNLRTGDKIFTHVNQFHVLTEH
jgi:hypothetical protein